jgi:hypothetical protein
MLLDAILILVNARPPRRSVRNAEPDFTTLRLRFALTVGNKVDRRHITRRCRQIFQAGLVQRRTAHGARQSARGREGVRTHASVCIQRHACRLRSHEVHAMIFRVVIPLLLLPLLAVTLPLMFALAWLHEALGDMAPQRQARGEPSNTSS